jgi:choline-sulfatase
MAALALEAGMKPATASLRPVVAGILFGCLLSACQPKPDPAAVLPIASGALRQRDVVLITLDTTRRDHIGCYGSGASATPHIDRLCERGLRLDQATAVAPVTLPAHSSMMTGLYPPQHGARYNGERYLADTQHTLAESLQSQGYRTAAFVSAFVLDHRFGLAQGFDHYDDHVSPSVGTFASSGNERGATAVTDAALNYLRAREAGKPLFLWVHYFDAHAPYLHHQLPADADDAQRYNAEIAHVDAELGRLLASQAIDWDQSLVLVLADHGESLGEHGERTHGLFVYDGTVAIPWIIAAPGLSASQTSALVSQIDLMPTVLDALGIEAPVGIEGRSLLLPARDAAASVYVETTLPYFDFRLSALQALRTPVAKFIAAPRPEFYRLDQDAQERTNLIQEKTMPPDAAILSERLDALLLDWPTVDAVPDDAGSGDAEVVARLRSLGYLSGTDLGTDLGDPKDAVELVSAHQLAAEAAGSGRLEEAVTHLDRALGLVPGARGALYLRARLLATLGRREAAERDIAEVNRSRPNADSLLLQAQLWVQSARYDDARALIAEAHRLDPQHGGVLIVEGDLAVVRQDFAAARSAYQQALQLDAQRIGRQAQARLSRLPR